VAQIANPEAVRFVNEVVRPLCEEARAFRVRVAALSTEWFLGKNNVFAAAGDTVEDGREAEGVSRLTAGDVTNAVAQLLAFEPNTEIVQKPCVRTLP
jgi:hypothetical protein